MEVLAHSHEAQKLNVAAPTGAKPSWQCFVCQKKFRFRSVFTAHIVFHLGVRSFQCSVCEKKFFLKQHLTRHMVTHSQRTDRPSSCQKPFTANSVLKPNLAVRSLLQCSICGKKMVNQRHLKMHILSHYGVPAFECSVCGRNYSCKANLNIHILAHSAVKPFECSACGTKFAYKSNLRRHAYGKHGDQSYASSSSAGPSSYEHSFECSTCGMQFDQEADLKVHAPAHFEGNSGSSEDVNPGTSSGPSGLSLHCCPFCCEQFLFRPYLANHFLGHRSDSAFRCEDCNCGFETKAMARKHKAKHAPVPRSYSSRPFLKACN